MSKKGLNPLLKSGSLKATKGDSFCLKLNKLSFNQVENKLISNVTAKEISDTDELKDLLIKQIENRVRWRESVINMINNDVNHFIEIGPGKVLSGLVKRINREVKIDTINNQEDIESLKI